MRKYIDELDTTIERFETAVERIDAALQDVRDTRTNLYASQKIFHKLSQLCEFVRENDAQLNVWQDAADDTRRTGPTKD